MPAPVLPMPVLRVPELESVLDWVPAPSSGDSYVGESEALRPRGGTNVAPERCCGVPGPEPESVEDSAPEISGGSGVGADPSSSAFGKTLGSVPCLVGLVLLFVEPASLPSFSCLSGLGRGLRRRKSQIRRRTRSAITATAPTTMPAIAPPLRLFELDPKLPDVSASSRIGTRCVDPESSQLL